MYVVLKMVYISFNFKWLQADETDVTDCNYRADEKVEKSLNLCYTITDIER